VPDSTASILIDEADHFIPIGEEDCFIFKNYAIHHLYKHKNLIDKKKKKNKK
jgi:hypothetical protein